MSDSTIRMRVEPILWTDDSQMTGDKIDIKTNGESIEFVLQNGNGFIVSQDTIEGFNQIKGTDITSHFKNGNIHHVNIDGTTAESIYWIRDDDGSTIGIDVAQSETMVIIMENQSISTIKSFKGIKETMYPEDDLKESSRYLRGFKWHDAIRPTDKDDIFRKIERQETSSQVLEKTETPQETQPEETDEDTPEETTAEDKPSQPHRPRRTNNN